MSNVKIKVNFHFVPFPQEIWDKNIDLSLGEFRLFGYILRYQFRFGLTRPIRFTDDELMRGKKRKDGKRANDGCGLTSHNSLNKAKARLLEKGWITVKEDLSDKARPKRWYMVSPDITEPDDQGEFEEDDWFGEDENSTNSRVSDRDRRVSNSDIKEVSSEDSRVSLPDSGVSDTDTRSDSKSTLSKSTLVKEEEKENIKEKEDRRASAPVHNEISNHSLTLLPTNLLPIESKRRKREYSHKDGPPGFRRFCSLHPYGGKERKEALGIWESKDLELQAEAICQALAEQTTWEENRKDNFRYFIHMPRYLRQDRWKDEPPPGMRGRTVTPIDVAMERLRNRRAVETTAIDVTEENQWTNVSKLTNS